MVSGGVVKTWSTMQATVAQSSGEAEYYAMVRAAAEALGIQSVMRDMGWETVIRLWVDSSAAKSMASRIGFGRVRHMEVKFLWLQEAVKDRRVEVRKVHGTENPADVLTKPKSYGEMAGLLDRVGVRVWCRRSRHATTGPNRDHCLGGGREPKPVVCSMVKECARGDARKDAKDHDEVYVPEKTPDEKPKGSTTTMPPRGRTETYGSGAETCGMLDG